MANGLKEEKEKEKEKEKKKEKKNKKKNQRKVVAGIEEETSISIA